jgi:hypothetical protein
MSFTKQTFVSYIKHLVIQCNNRGGQVRKASLGIQRCTYEPIALPVDAKVGTQIT